MRLIRTTGTDPELVYFADEKRIPQYVILSHVWEEEEVTFQHMQGPSKNKDMRGWSKIVRACEVARNEDWEYIWIDTCCIDKSSSSELSEAINSMYRYYSEAQICYAYLADIASNLPKRSLNLAFHACKWFTRGWTLQELIAPMTVVFFAKDWEKIGTKASLQAIITEITGIPSGVLLQNNLSKISIAKKMSWAAGRETTRIEDRAYSLLGIFGVFMPTIYGEGTHAFIRLQEEILKMSDDQTIFAWKAKADVRALALGIKSDSGLLATSPDDFEASGEYEQSWSDSRQPYSMTNMGILVHLPLLRIHDSLGPDTADYPSPFGPRPEYLAVLNCCRRQSEHLAIHVRRVDKHRYARVDSHLLVEDNSRKVLLCGKTGESPQELLFRARTPAAARVKDDFLVGPNRVSVFFPSGQGVRVEQSCSCSEYAAEHSSIGIGITKTADGNIDLGLKNKMSHAFLFVHDPGDRKSNQQFVVVVGIHQNKIWLDIVLDFGLDKPNLERIQRSYYRDTYGSGQMLSENLDKITKPLTDNEAVLVEARPQKGDRQSPSFMVNIRITETIYPGLPPIVIHKYSFSVSISKVPDGFSQPEAYHPDSWEAMDNGTMNLFLHDWIIFGILVFQHQKNGNRFAVALGVYNDVVWSHIEALTDAKYEQTSDIHASCGKQFEKWVKSNNNSRLYASEHIPSKEGRYRATTVTASVRSSLIGKSRTQYQSKVTVSGYSGR
ncbi:heterokaryon incompatibility protein-domain-containing protein [Rhodocollybia butyracea]|uniref:Heterokaryon incompatibility protein-domain-containing protein n=1 Tax=Rhodocollybia butyracea TaxID=206335 RepID=A0A9P5TXK8_9AGAR|nr:heterokaryon incompatibility protein-domain-containing protein [Rhodocollybia butyracea]